MRRNPIFERRGKVGQPGLRYPPPQICVKVLIIKCLSPKYYITLELWGAFWGDSPSRIANKGLRIDGSCKVLISNNLV